MKINSDFILREINGESVVVAVGASSQNFNGMLKLNPTGKFIWKLLETDTTPKKILNAVMEEYYVDEVTAKADIANFLHQLREAGIVVS